MNELEYEVADHVATIRLNRPEKRNAFTFEMVDAWADRLLEAQADPLVRAIVVTGTGKGFCSGIDLSWVAEYDQKPLQFKQALTDHIHRVPLALENVDKPVIAAINGDAMGAGLDMALMCDLRLISDNARLAMSYVKVGLVPGDGGCWLLPRLVGMPKALELLWTGDVVTADQAAEIGLVNSVHDSEELMDATYALARRIAAAPPVAVRMIKRTAYQSQRLDLRTSLDLISSHMGVVRTTDDSVEAYRAFSEKRVGEFVGR